MSEVSTYNTTHQSFKNRKKYGNLKLMKKLIYKKIKNRFINRSFFTRCENHYEVQKSQYFRMKIRYQAKITNTVEIFFQGW